VVEARIVNRSAPVRDLDQLGFGTAPYTIGVRGTVAKDDVEHALRFEAVRS
jgi:hypothetical protein